MIIEEKKGEGFKGSMERGQTGDELSKDKFGM